MKSVLSYLFLFIQLVSCTNAQEKEAKQYLALCTQGKGCRFSEITISAGEVDKLLRKSNFWTTASPDATLILENCESVKNEQQTLEEIDRSYGGKAVILKKIDLEKYLKEKGCFACPNHTKKISFFGSGVGESGERYAGNGFFYLNIQADEAYMPNEAFRQMGLMDGEGSNAVTVDQFIRKNVIETYTVADGKKFRQVMDLGYQLGLQQEMLNEQRFKEDFKKTGKTRKYNGNDDVEYVGKDNEGKTINIWLTPSRDVCLPLGRFDAVGFYNLGYLSLDGITYLITEMSGSDFHLKLNSVTDATYQFNPAGYQTVKLPGIE